jgi:sugar-specific transcriptional regulator TrmB
LTLEFVADEHFLGLLQDMGLTHQEAVVYSVLVSHGPLPAKKVGEVAGLAREHSYQVLKRLETKGLVEVRLSDYSLFVATEPRVAVASFVSRIEDQSNSLKEKAYEVGARLQALRTKRPACHEAPGRNDPQLRLVFGKQVQAEFERELAECKDDYMGIIMPEIMATPNGLRTLESLQIAAKRNVRVRVITESLPITRRYIGRYSKELSFRHNTAVAHGVRFSIFDRSRVIQAMFDPVAKDEEKEIICSGNRTLVKGLMLYFEQFWETSIPVGPNRITIKSCT